MRLTFGNLSLDVNIFFIFNQLDLDDEGRTKIYEISLRNSLVQDFFYLSLDTNTIEAYMFNPFTYESLLIDDVIDIDHVEKCFPFDDASIDCDLDLANVAMFNLKETNVKRIIEEAK